MLDSVATTGTQVSVVGTLRSAVSTNFRIEFFANAAADGEAGRYLGFAHVTTDGTGVALVNATFSGTLAAGEFVTAAATRADGTFTSFFETSEVGASVVAVDARKISGTLHHDVNGNASVADDSGAVFANAANAVRLYLDDGDGIIDAGDLLVATVSTDAGGGYSFANLGDGTYWVVVDSKTLGADSNVWAEQTYAVTGAASTAAVGGFLIADGALYGGRDAGVSDDATTLTTAQHVTKVELTATDVTGVDSGFSFNVVTSARGDANDDDNDALSGRMQQGTLRQFILNANAIAGSNEMRFVPGGAAFDVSGPWWEITVAGAALPTIQGISGENTIIDGTAYAAVVNGAALDTNVGAAGVGGGVGAGAGVLTLSAVARPELEIVDGGGYAVGLDIQATGTIVRDLAIHGFGSGPVSGDIYIGDVTGTVIESALIGMTAAGADPGGAARTQGTGITVDHGDGGILRNSLVGYAALSGIDLREATGWRIEGNELRGGGWLDDGWDAVNMLYNSSADIIGNLIENNVGPGIDLVLGSGSTRIESNTIRNNASVSEQYGVDFENATGTNVVRWNLIAGNTGAGVLVSGTTTSVQITENVIYGNTGLGIDLSSTSLIGDGVTMNDNAVFDADNGPNGYQNFPVLTGAATNGTTVTIAGSLDSAAGTAYRIEFFANGVGGPRFLGALSPDLLVGASGSATFSASLAKSVAVSETITATATNLTTLATSEFSAAVVAGAPGSISGTIYHDINGNADITDDGASAVFANALNAVALYLDDGDGIIDSGDSFVSAVSTDALGGYVFGSLAAGDYYVVVNSQRLSPNPALWAEQTFAVTGAATGGAFTITSGALYGGRERLGPGSGTSDNAAGSITTAEHVTKVTLAGGNVTGIDSGFSFTAITSNRGDAIDDDTSNARMQQGTLRQFILNANALAGPQTANFSINYSGGGGAQTIDIINAELPMITGTVTLD
ncbi:MAG: right-handed parallel beta-helix repeat-containing protein, partial [Burkholderiales bacterium]